jgi:hypothetical protein
MKISNLTQLTAIDRDYVIPTALAGENKSVTIGTLLDAVPSNVIEFAGFATDSSPVIVTNATANTSTVEGTVVYSTVYKRFYYRVESGLVVNYYANWTTFSEYMATTLRPRTDCLFVEDSAANNGTAVATTGLRLYHFTSGNKMVRVGLTPAERAAITSVSLLTPIEVESEDAMQQMIDAGTAVDGQIYYVAESE